MGIQGLLPLLKSIQKPTHLRNFAGQTLGIDAYGWLHRGTKACAIELAEQKPTKKHIDFCISRVRMLIHFGVKPYLVFDGDYLPSKEHTEKGRAAKRKESKRLGLELLGMKRVSQAYLELQKAVDVSPSMARELIEELKVLDVPYVVAPYEADVQLAYLEKEGIISGVLSEDSDLLVFGVKCLLTKLDQYGECVMVNRQDFTACRDISLVGWTDKEFRMMAMLSGCDYLPGINNMGLKTAYRLVRQHKTIERVIRSVQFDGKMKVPPKYLEAYQQAERTFLYQWAYCPTAQRLVNLNSVPAGLETSAMPYIGEEVIPELATGVAVGDLDPNTKEPLKFNRRQPSSYHRQQIVQTPDEKPGKPITEFFKAMRTPLAELDPNSFTPSPSQQRLLENQQSTSWSASQVPAARPQALDRVAANNRRQSAPQPSARAVSDNWATKHRNEPKRQRLCSHSRLAQWMEGDVGLDVALSPFFPKSATQPSPSMRKAGSKKNDFELWSDDSTAEAAASVMAAVQQESVTQTPSSKKRKKLQVFADSTTNEDTSTPSQLEESQNTAATAATTASQWSVVDTPATSFASTQSQPDETVFTKGVNANFAALKSSFAFSSAKARNAPSRTQSTPLFARNIDRFSALSEKILPSAAASPHAKKASRLSEASDLVEEQAEADTEDMVPASSPIAAPNDSDDKLEDTAGNNSPNSTRQMSSSMAAQGSEDLLVPNSPDSTEEETRTKPRLDFGRFVFAA